jgi:hypothetical protein
MDRYRTHLPLFVQIFGWPGVGKTVFLSALTLVLSKMSKVWANYAFMPASDVAQAKLAEINRLLTKGFLPAATQRGKYDVYIMILQGMERWGDRMLVTRDCSGEVFDTFQVSSGEAPYLEKIPTTMVLASLSDLRDATDGKSPDMLINSFINTLRLHPSSAGGRRMVAVLTKGDLIEDLSADLREYLTADPIWTALNSPGMPMRLEADGTKKYVEKMQWASDTLARWLQETDVAWINFIRLAQQHKISLRFSVISSTGGPVGPKNALPTTLAPRRVLDPYFWALESGW